MVLVVFSFFFDDAPSKSKILDQRIVCSTLKSDYLFIKEIFKLRTQHLEVKNCFRSIFISERTSTSTFEINSMATYFQVAKLTKAKIFQNRIIIPAVFF